MRVLLVGTLITVPIVRQSVKGKPFVTLSLRDEGVIASCICFDTDIVDELAALKKGASLCVVGRGELRSWVGKDSAEHHGLGVTVEQVLPLAAAVKRTRGKSKPEPEPEPDPKPELAAWPAGTKVLTIPNDPF